MLEKAIYSDKGGRPYNEDACATMQQASLFCAVMADGLGGHGGGDRASQMAVETVGRGMESLEAGDVISDELLTEWFIQANERIVGMQTRECQMKTTLAVLCIDEDRECAKWAHLGDSRIYHFIDKKESFCTFDHSVSRMAVLAGEIALEEIRFHRDRSKLLKVVGKEGVSKPEIGTCELGDGGHHAFLLCTDGFWEYVTEQEMEQTLMQSKNPEQWIDRMRDILQEKVDGTNDNNSAIAIFCE